MSVEAIVAQLAVIQRTITGVKAAFEHMPSQIDVPPPVVLNEIESGEVESPRFGSQRRQTHHIRMTLLVALQTDLAEAEKQARPFVKRFVDTFDLKKGLNGSATTSDITSWEYGEVRLRDDARYMAVSFRLRAVELEQGAGLYAV